MEKFRGGSNGSNIKNSRYHIYTSGIDINKNEMGPYARGKETAKLFD